MFPFKLKREALDSQDKLVCILSCWNHMQTNWKNENHCKDGFKLVAIFEGALEFSFLQILVFC